MCCEHLLRGEVPYKVSNTETQEVREYNYLGHWDERNKDNTKHGFYTIGATGCAYMLYDGVIHFDNEVCRFAYKKDPNRTLLCDVIEFVEIQKGLEISEDLFNG